MPRQRSKKVQQSSSETSIPQKTFVINEDTELRFEVEAKNAKVVLELKCGLAEVFGSELTRGKKYTFTTGARIAVFTYHGCTLVLHGDANGSYVAKETPTTMHLNVHGGLEQMRNTAVEKNSRGPITMVVGPADVGKSTLCRILLNYAARVGRRPMFVDLDVGQGLIPGTIGSLLVERPACIVDGFSQEAPLLYHFGHTSPEMNLTHYNVLVSRMADIIFSRMVTNKKANQSGVVINTCGWVNGDGYGKLVATAKAFEVDLILVIDHERLYNDLKSEMPSFVDIVPLPKSGGVQVRTVAARNQASDKRVHEYFYGQSRRLHPYSFVVPFNELRIYKIGSLHIPDSCLPLGVKPEDARTKLVAVVPGMHLMHHLLAVTFCANAEGDVIGTNIAGYICVTNVDMEKKRITVLSPQDSPLPKTILIVSEVQFMDS